MPRAVPPRTTPAVAGIALCAVALALACAGCAPSPLVGRWQIDGVFPLVGPITETWLLRADGVAEYSITATNCAGTVTYGEIGWSHTASTISFRGPPSCRGGVRCTSGGADVNIGCGAMPRDDVTGVADYTLAEDGRTLTLGMRAFARVE